MRQVRINDKWINGIPTEAGQRFRFADVGGWSYGTYQPDAVEPVADMRITKRAFFDRLLPEEERAIDLASFGDTESAAEVRRAIRRLEQSPFADLAFEQTISFVNAMEKIGLLSGEGRAQEILTAPIRDNERYRGDL
jgi:hypothetical protein